METTEHLSADVAVMGGGVAGVCAALAASRMGAQVVLVQDRPVLGGNASSEVRMHISGAEALIRGLKDGLDYRETGILETLKLEEAVRNPQRAAFMLDLVLWEAVNEDPNITLLLNTACESAETEEATLPPPNELVRSGVQGIGEVGPVRRIVKATARQHSTETVYVIDAKYFIDATGDGRLGAVVGADFQYGRESRDTYGESFGAEVADGKVLGSSLLFTARRYDHPVPYIPPKWAKKYTEEDLKLRSHGSLEYGFWWVEWGGQLNTIKDNEAIRDELLAVVMGIWDHIKNGGDHGADNWALDWIGVVPGKRESRRFLGDHVLVESDVLEAPLFADRVAFGGWPIDIHVPEGIGKLDERPNITKRVNQPYSIPLRTLYSRNIVNMFMAGRDISASHVAFSSTRVMGTCALLGQAAGTAAATAAVNELPAARTCVEPEWIECIQKRLVRDDAFLIDFDGRDPQDLAQSARVSASSWIEGGEPAQVTNGVTRRTAAGENMWISQDGFPQQLWLEWEQPVRLNVVELTLDTGLHRELRLSMSDLVASWSIRGPQPETLSDLSVRLYHQGELVKEERFEGNYQRKLQLRFEASLTCDKLEVVASKAWDMSCARVFEVRAYNE